MVYVTQQYQIQPWKKRITVRFINVSIKNALPMFVFILRKLWLSLRIMNTADFLTIHENANRVTLLLKAYWYHKQSQNVS